MDFWLAWKLPKHQKHMSNVTFDGCAQYLKPSEFNARFAFRMFLSIRRFFFENIFLLQQSNLINFENIFKLIKKKTK